MTKRFSGCLIDGYKFHTMKRDAKNKTQNFGVTLISLTSSFAISTVCNNKNIIYIVICRTDCKAYLGIYGAKILPVI